jgi:hypothetical protein
MIRSARMGRSSFSIATVVSIGLLIGCAKSNQPFSSGVRLDSSQEVPKVLSSGRGVGEITVLPDRTVGGRITISDVVATVAHIHVGAAGEIGPAIVTLTKTSSTSFTVPSGTRLSEAHYAAYQAGNLYVNVHSARFPGGEIRGQIFRPRKN